MKSFIAAFSALIFIGCGVGGKNIYYKKSYTKWNKEYEKRSKRDFQELREKRAKKSLKEVSIKKSATTLLNGIKNDIKKYLKEDNVKVISYKTHPILYVNLGPIVHFKTDRYNIEAKYRAKLLDIVRELKKTNQSILIVGHTDSVGSDRYNQALSELRAREIYKFFIKNGISKSRLDYIGYGEEQPISTNATKEGRARNRRVELLISKDLNISSNFLENRQINSSYWNNHLAKEAGKVQKSQKGWTKNLSELQIKNKLTKLKKPVREEFRINLKTRTIYID